KAAIGGELASRIDDESALRGPVAAGSVKVGSRVYVPKLRAEAEVVEVLSSGQIRVMAGALKLLLRTGEVRSASAGEAAPPKSPSKNGKKGAKGIAFDAAADPDIPIQTAENTVDLRGLRA